MLASMQQIDLEKFRTLVPSRFSTVTISNTLINPCFLRQPFLRFAVLDSPAADADDDSPTIVAMIVPDRRERDWIFCTESGHLQLLFATSYSLSRLILIGNTFDPNSVQPSTYNRPPLVSELDMQTLQGELASLALDFHPIVCFRDGNPQPLFASYQDEIVYRVTLERLVGTCVGEFEVVDLEFERNDIRRMLSFKRMPNLVQSQATLIPKSDDDDAETGLGGIGLKTLTNMEGVEFVIQTKAFVHPYLAPMISALFLIASPLYDLIKQEIRPRALCLGVGGGTLLSFLNTQLGFEVVGVEIDEAVLDAARKYFGLQDLPSLKLIVGDAIELIRKVARDTTVKIDGLDAKFDVVMVDLDSDDARNGINAPPLELVRKRVFEDIRSLLHDHGVIVINVISPNKSFYQRLIQILQDVSYKVYEIVVWNDANFVLMATLTPRASNDLANTFMERLIDVISGSYTDSLREL